MVVRQGLPEGRNIRLQEAITWAFTGWSWSNATSSLNDIHEVEQRDDFPTENSIYALIPEVPQEYSMERDGALFSRFDASLSDACFRGEISLTGRRTGSKNFETIPHTYFFKPRGFSYLYGDKIDDTPTNASLDVIFANRDDGDWEDAVVDRDQFLAWFNKAKAHIVGVAEIPDTPSPTIYRTGGQGKPSAMHLIIREAERRVEIDDVPDSKKLFTEQLSAWLSSSHKLAPNTTPKAIGNNSSISELHRAVLKRRADAKGGATAPQ